MPPILNAQGLCKSYGATPLFADIGFTVSEGDRIGLIGPNGSGKSTLLGILSGEIGPDSGNVARRRHARLGYVTQESQFAAGLTVRAVIAQSLERAGIAEDERAGRTVETLGRTGFEDFDAEAASLSGGWRKRLAIAEALVQKPDVLLLDEPTNHLDLEGIEWLEELLRQGRFACVVVSHDRYFLENVCTETVELDRAYPGGILRVSGNYSAFLVEKDAFLSAQARHQESLENRVRTEIEWLRRGPKARATKAKARINTANQMISELADLNSRMRTDSAGIDFTATERRTRRLVELERLGFTIGGRTLFENLNFILTAGTRVGLVGPNGSGKTTMLRLLRSEIAPSAGGIKKADFLKIVYFDQKRTLDTEVTLRRALAPDSDAVVYQDRVIHVASWASRFLFTSEQLNQPVERLSGGERARVLIAQLMLQPADLLLLDEPTNDLDIPTLEILEESLLEYRGALVLVTHDRYMLDRVSTVVLGLDGRGGAEAFADYSQWEAWQEQRGQYQKAGKSVEAARTAAASATPQKKKLSYLEAREYATIEQRIAEAEQVLSARRAALEDSAIVSDSARLVAAHSAMEEAQKAVDELIARWAELEEKQG